MRSPLSTAVAIATGLIVLILGYLLPSAFSDVPAVNEFRALFLGWAVILAAFATLVSILYLVSTHWRKLRAPRTPDRYSFFTIFFFIATVLAGSAVFFLGQYQAEYQQIVVSTIQVPIESSLMALLAVTLTLAGFRLFQRRKGILVVTFILSALVYLLLNSGILAALEPILSVNSVGSMTNVLHILPVAGGRGILLGIALGSVMAGLRILFGAERPYSG